MAILQDDLNAMKEAYRALLRVPVTHFSRIDKRTQAAMGSLVDRIAFWDGVSNEETQVFYESERGANPQCEYCGGPDPRCQCWNDE
jgi:hypothetical protein